MALAIVQNQTVSVSSVGSTPGAITLTGGAPGNGNLLIAIVGMAANPSSLVVNTASWTQFDQVSYPVFNLAGNTVYQLALYRYAQPGDLALLPAFCTSGNTQWGYTVYEISGVTGTWTNDFLCSSVMVQYDGNNSTPVTQNLAAYPAIANGSLAITAVMNLNNLETPALSGSWTLDFSNWFAYPSYGSVASAHRFMNSGDVLDGKWTQTGWEISSGFIGGAITLILTPTQPTTPYPRHCWQTQTNTGHPGVFTLPWQPKTGSLLIAYLDWFDGTIANPAVDTGWTVFKTIDNVTHYIIGMYRYVQMGDTATLPNFTTSGSAAYSITVLEVTGVGGTFSADHGTDVAECVSPVGPNPWTTLTSTTSANNSLGVLHYAEAGAQYFVYANWQPAETVSLFTYYGGASTFFKFFPTSGSTIQATINPGANSPAATAYIMSGLLHGSTPPPPGSAQYQDITLWG